MQVRRLDSLVTEGMVPSPDFIKVDVEGYEKAVLLGAEQALRGALGFEAETAFTVSVEYPTTHFGTLLDIALKNHQRPFDINFNRVPGASFQRALMREHGRSVEDQISVGRPATLNVLFCRDLIEERERPANYPTPTPALESDHIIKQAVVYELYGLNDVAIDTIERLADRIDRRVDIEKAVRLLADPECHTSGPFTRRLRSLEEQVEQISATHAEAMAEGKRVLAAERAGAAARIQELQEQVEEIQRAHAEAMTDGQRLLAAEKEEATARIRALEEEHDRYRQAHAESMARADSLLAAEKDAATARIRELEAHPGCQRAWVRFWRLGRQIIQLRNNPPRAMRRLGRILSALKSHPRR